MKDAQSLKNIQLVQNAQMVQIKVGEPAFQGFISNHTLSSWNHHLVSLGDLPFRQLRTYLSLSIGLAFSVELDSIESMLMHIELTVMAGDHESYKISKQICPLL